MKESLLGKKTLEDEVNATFGMSEEEALAIEKEEAAAQIEEDAIAAEELAKEEAAAKLLADEEAARIEEDRLANLTDEEKEEEAKKKEDDDDDDGEDDDIIIGGDDDDDDPAKKKEIKDTQITEEAFFEFASKKLGREVKTFEDLNQELPVKLASEQLEIINSFVEDTGRDAFDWFKMQQLNVKDLSSEQLVKAQLSIKFPTLKSHEIDRKFNRLYKLDTETFTEDEVSDAELDLKIDADIAKTELTKLSDGYKMPVTEDRKVNDAVQQREDQRIKDAYVDQMVKDVDAITTFDFNIDGSKVKYKPSRVDRKQMKGLNQNLETFFDQFRNADGSLNTNELSEGLWKATKGNVEKLLGAVKGRYLSEGKGGQIKKQKNTNLPANDGRKGTKSATEDKIQTDLEAVLNQESSGGRGKGMKIQI